jgi:riboflavin kinase, archaea type
MMKLRGEVRTGKNDFFFWMEKLSSYYMQKTGMIFVPGTLNVHLIEYKYYFPLDCIRLDKEEYEGSVSVSLTPCKILTRDAYILRTDSDTGKQGYSPEQILEIATDVRLRDEFHLEDGDVVEVEVNRGKIVKI